MTEVQSTPSKYQLRKVAQKSSRKRQLQKTPKISFAKELRKIITKLALRINCIFKLNLNALLVMKVSASIEIVL